MKKRALLWLGIGLAVALAVVIQPLLRRDRLYYGKSWDFWGNALSDGNPELQEKAIEVLEEVTKDYDRDVRYRAVKRLGLLGPKASKAIPSLVDALSDEDHEVRREAAWALGGMGPLGEKAVPALERAAHDPCKDVRSEALSSLSRLRRALGAGGGSGSR